MFQKSYITGRLIIPLLALAAYTLIVVSVDYVGGYSLPAEIVCLKTDINRQVDKANVLFIGSSRTGAAVDPVYIESLLEDRAGKETSVYKINSTGPDLIFYNMMARDYLERAGAPEHVYIELMYAIKKTSEFYETHKNRPLIPYLSTKGIMLGDVSDYTALLVTEPFDESSKVIFRKYKNPAQFLASKSNSAFYHFIRHPVSSYGDWRDCQDTDSWRRKGGLWIYGSLDKEAVDSDVLLTGALRTSPQFQYSLRNIEPRLPDSAARVYENESLNALKDLFLRAGTKSVNFVFFPSYHEEMSTLDRATYEEKFAGANLVFLQDLYADKPTLSEMFRDPHHFNKSGALIVSRALSENISDQMD